MSLPPPDGASENAAPKRSLDLVGDGDEHMLVVDLENTFAIKFMDAELDVRMTAGDINALIWRRLSERTGDGGGARCMNAMAFYALRRTLIESGAERTLAPADRLDRFDLPPKELARRFRENTGLALAFEMGRLGNAGQWMIAAALFAPLFALFTPWFLYIAALAAVLAAAGKILDRLDTGAFKPGETIACAAERIVQANFGELASRGGRLSQESVWRRIRELLAHHSACEPGEIGKQTVLIDANAA